MPLDEQRKTRCKLNNCCCVFSLKMGAIIVGTFEIVTMILSIASLTFGLLEHTAKVRKWNEDPPVTDLDINPLTRDHITEIYCILFGPFGLFLLIGVIFDISNLILVWIIKELVVIVVHLIFSVSQAFLLLISGRIHVMIYLAIIALIVIGIHSYFLMVVHSYYRELQENIEYDS